MSLLNKNQLNAELAKLSNEQQYQFNLQSGNNLVYLENDEGGTSYSTSVLINSVNNLSDPDYFWLEDNSTGFVIAGKRGSRPC